MLRGSLGFDFTGQLVDTVGMSTVHNNYVIPEGTADGVQYFMNVEISPETLANGQLVYRLDPKLYPQWGVDLD